MEDTKKKRTAWEVLREELLHPLALELRPSVAGMKSADDGAVVEFTFQDLQKRTICESFPRGLDFFKRSRQPSSLLL